MKRKIIIGFILCAIISISIIPLSRVFALPDGMEEDWYNTDWTFSKNATAKTITLTKYKGTEETYKIPAKAIIDGVEYSVIFGSGAGKTSAIKNLSFENGVKINFTSSLFSGNTTIEKVDLKGADTSSATTFYYMFQNCTNLKEVSITDIDSSKVTSVGSMFSGATNLQKVVMSGLDLSKVTSVTYWFRNAANVEEIDFSNTNMSKVTSFAYASPDNSYASTPYMGMKKLKKINMSNFNTASLNNAERMFTIQVGSYDNQNHIEEIDVTNWNTSSITKFYETFAYCGVNSDITIKGLDTLDTSKVKDFTGTFIGATNVKDLTGVEKWDTSSATDMHSMFSGAKSITKLDLSSWDTSNVTDIASMFVSCQSLSDLNVSTWDTSKVKEMDTIFKGCASLEVLNLKSWTSESVENKSGSHMLEMLGAKNPGTEYPLTPLKEITLNDNFKFSLFQQPGLRSGYWSLKEGTEEQKNKKYTVNRLYTAYNNGSTPGEEYSYDHTYVLTELDPANHQYYAHGWGTNPNTWEVHYPENKFKSYCINKHRAAPHGYYDRVLVDNNKIINDGYLDGDNHGWEPMGSTMEEALIALIYYGWGNDADKIQEKYGLSDTEYWNITQQAIWDFTDRYDNKSAGKFGSDNANAAYDELVSRKFSDIPNGEDLKLYLYESAQGQQNLLSITGLQNQAYAGVRVLKLANPVEEGRELVPLEDAEFTIYDSNGDPVCTIVSDAEGYATKYNTDTMYGLSEGVYTIRETKAPRGYIAQSRRYTFIVREEDDNQIILVGKLNGSGDNVPMIFENNENPSVKGGGIKIKKVDEKGNIVRGAKFEIYDASGDRVRGLTTGDDGTAMTGKKTLELNKEYTIKEIEAPAGYKKSDDEKKFTLTEDGEYYSTVFTFTNTFKRGKAIIEAEKVLNNGTLEKDQFEFELLDSDDNVIATAKNDKNGNIKFEVEYTGEDIGYKVYKIREIKGTNSYIEYDEHEEEVTVHISDNGGDELECTVEYDSDGSVFENIKNDEPEPEPEPKPEPIVGGLTVKVIIKDHPEKDETFDYTITLNDISINGKYGDVEFVNGIAKFKLKNGEKVSIPGLPENVGYRVIQEDSKGYTTEYENETGHIIGNETIDVLFINSKVEEEIPEVGPEPEPEPEPQPELEPEIKVEHKKSRPISPKTGDNGNITLWIVIMITSVFVMKRTMKYTHKNKKAKHFK